MTKKILLAIGFVLLAGTSGYLFLYLATPDVPVVHHEELKSKQHYFICDFDIPNELVFAGEKVPVEMFYTRESIERELIVNTYLHSSTLLLLKRSHRWFPVIEPILKKYGIPEDFKFLAMIESNLTNAVSPSGAVGFWQFLSETAKEYDLEVNKNVDMRYNVELETEAACKYFLKAYERFQNWALVAASYNAGQRRISDLLKDQKAISYFDLLMSQETERYLFRMIALKMIYENPMHYGFFISDESKYAVLDYHVVVVDKDIANLTDFAKEHGISYKLLKYYNPWLRSQKLNVPKKHSFEIKIPNPPFDMTHEKLRLLYEQAEKQTISTEDTTNERKDI
ncbi:MAG: lytic transglycosylase domain-containing protein [Lentimicrobiaceae bacterium]|jgi:hypothetical protein|nr:lytic transglycosylase domain-containing protein [Lentimicrobiaceae bacterium]